SHDLQEPLRKIRTFSERLSHKYKNQLEEEGFKYIDRIENAAERMQRLINDLLAFSKISHEDNPPVKSDLNVLVDEVIKEMEESITEKKAKISIEALPSLY